MITNGFAAVGTTVKTGEARILTQETEGEGESGNLLAVDDESVMGLTREAWRQFARRWKTLVGIMLMPQAIWIVLMVVMVGGVVVFGLAGLGSDLGIALLVGPLGLLIGFGLLAGVLMAVWAQVALYFAVSHKYEGIGVFEAYKVAFSKIGAWWWVMFLVTLATFGGYLLFIVPGILAGFWFMFAAFVLVDEDIGGVSALAKSKFYMRGMIGFVFSRMLGYMGIMVVAMIAYGVVGVGLEMALGEEVGGMVTGLIWGIFSLIATPLGMTLLYLIYQVVRRKKAGVADTMEKERATVIGLSIWGMVASVLMVMVVIGAVVAGLHVLGDLFSGEIEFSGESIQEEYDYPPIQELQLD